MKVSVIIPTFNGRHKLDNILNALSVQNIKDFETIVIIDGSTDGTEEYLKQKSFSLNLIIHSQINKGRASVRNKGAELASGELLIFFDDDMRPEPDCVDQHLRHHRKHSHSLMSGAQIDDDRLADTPFKTYKCFLSNRWSKHLCTKQNVPLEFHELHLTAANFSIRKKDFEKLGGFDENLRDAEDFDLAVRAFKQGYSIFYNHKAFAWHDDFPSCRSFIKRQREYQEYHNYLMEKKPDFYHDVLKLKRANKINAIKKMFYYLWKPDFFIGIADGNYLAFLPKFILYKIYDWIVASHVILKRKMH